MKRVFAIAGLAMINAAAFGQDAPESAQQSFWSDPFNHPLLPFYIVIAFILVVIVLVVMVAFSMLSVLRMLTREADKEKAARSGIAYAPTPTWWDRLTQKLNASVPVEKEEAIELDHSYDGIKELDNHLPPWWKWLFYATIAFAGVYLLVYHLSGNLPLQTQEYENELALAEEQAKQLKASQPREEIDENNVVFTNDQALIEKGKAVFMDNNCGSCHRTDGGGNAIGPNLTDEYWLHGGDAKQIFTTVKNGVVDKGMPAWGRVMSPQNVRDVTFFILSLQGSNPPNAKAPQGELLRQVKIVMDSSIVKAGL